MKALNNKFNFIFKMSMALGLLLFFSCKKKVYEAPPTPTGVIAIHLHTNINNEEVDTSIASVDATGRKIKLKIAQFYAYNFVVKKTDGSTVIFNSYILKTIGTEMYVLGSVPTGNYSSVSFNVGVDESSNMHDPSMCASSSPLFTQSPPMWFGSASQGYMFMNVQGCADTTASQTAPIGQYQHFSYQLGTNSMLKTINLPAMINPISVTTSATSGNPATFHVICDYGKLLSGVNFKTQNCATPFSNVSVASQIASNIPGMFRYE